MVLGGSGTVEVGNLCITVAPIGLAEEWRLMRELRRRAEQALGDPYTRCKAVLDKMTPEDRAEAVREIVRSEIRGTPLGLDAILQFRATDPGWVAEELYVRGHKTTPGLTREGLRAVITSGNAEEVFERLMRVATGRTEVGGPKSTRSGSP